MEIYEYLLDTLTDWRDREPPMLRKEEVFAFNTVILAQTYNRLRTTEGANPAMVIGIQMGIGVLLNALPHEVDAQAEAVALHADKILPTLRAPE